MTIEEMRAILGLGPEVSDEDVAAAYVQYLLDHADDADADVALVTLAEAKGHLRITDTAQDDDIDLKRMSASAIVVDYIKRPDHGWTAETAPFLIKAAVLLVLGVIFDNRDGSEALSGATRSILERYRDPALA